MKLTEVHYKAIAGFLEGKHIDEIAEECGVSSRTIYRWQKKPEFKRELHETILAHSKNRLAKAVDALYDEIINNGSAAAARVLFDAVGLTGKQQDKPVEVHNHIDLDKIKEELSDL